MAKLDQDQLSQIVSAVISALQVQQGASASAKPAPQFKNSFAKFDPIQKDRGLIAGFKRKGVKEADIHLLDRDDPSKPFNVRPYGNAEQRTGWLGQGRQVRRGERSVHGLFHISQTDPLPAKPALTAEQKGVFEAAKKALKAKKAKLTPVS